MKKFRLIVWILYGCILTVAFSLVFFTFVVLPLLFNLHNLEQDWSIDLLEIVQKNNGAWNILMQPEANRNYRRRRQNTEIFANNNNKNTDENFLSYRPQYNGRNKKIDSFPVPHQLYNYQPEKPEFGYGYAKLRCCCALHDDPSTRHMKISYKCPIGVPGLQGMNGLPGNNGIDGEAGPDGEDYPIQPPRENNYGIQSQLVYLSPPQNQNSCGSCPLGAPGLPGPPGKPGERGQTGRAGRNGYHGQPGTAGIPGQLGDVSPRGRPGVQGPSGTRGLDGVKANVGEKGCKGVTGPPGLRGSNGVAGSTGTPGAYGEKGDPGPNGIKGQRGQDGFSGSPGAPGIPGQDALYCKCPYRSHMILQASTDQLDNGYKSFEAVPLPKPLTSKKFLIDDSEPRPPSIRPRMPSYFTSYNINAVAQHIQTRDEPLTKKIVGPQNSKVLSKYGFALYSKNPTYTSLVDPRHPAIKNRPVYEQLPTVLNRPDFEQKQTPTQIRTIDTTMLSISPTPPLPSYQTTFATRQWTGSTIKEANTEKLLSRHAHEPPPLENVEKYDGDLSEKNDQQELDNNEGNTDAYDELPFHTNDKIFQLTRALKKYSRTRIH